MDELREFRCKTCGENLDIRDATDGVIECEYCQSVFTLPKEEASPEVLSFFRMGEHDLDICDWEGAYSAFKKAEEKDGTEPEAHWGLALASYKVQYLKDYVNNRLQPICHEINEKKFSESADYKNALKYATDAQREEYEKKAAEIDYIKEEFFKLKQSGLNFDCFICVKLTDDNGEMTEDCKDAKKIYNLLKKKGYSPFFSEISVKNRTGTDYEAMILYALYSCESMLVVCREEKYLKTKWVKNEYTRFLRLINDEEKESDSITFVYYERPIEKLPGKRGKLQGIDFSRREAEGQITDFVEKHTPQARARRKEEACLNGAAEIVIDVQKKKKRGPIIAAVAFVLTLIIGLSILLPSILGDNGLTIVKNNEYDATVSISNGELPKNTVFSVASITEGTKYEKISESVADLAEIFYAYDMELNNKGVALSPNGNVTVTLPLPSDIPADEAVVYYVSDSGVATVVASTVFQNYITFTTSHFSIYVIAQQKLARSTIIFHANSGNGTMANAVVLSDTTTTLPANSFDKKGYYFSGWASSDNGEIVALDKGTYQVGHNSVYNLYALWSPNTNTIIFNANGGNGEMQNQTAKTGEEITLTENSFTKTGYVFSGWATSEDGQVLYNNKSNYTMGEESSYTLYAVWLPNKNTVVFNANGGDGEMPEQTAKTDSTFNLPQCSFRKRGYSFAGWSTVLNGTVTYLDKANYTMGSSSSVTLYAVWEPIVYEITYWGMYESNGYVVVYYTVETQTFTSPTPSRTGYTFLGWSTSDNDDIVNPRVFEQGTTGDFVFYARWEANSYTITYNADGGTVLPESQDVKYMSSFVLPIPEKVGYFFAGWYNNNTLVQSGIYNFTSSIVLTAKWEAKVYTVQIQGIDVNPSNQNDSNGNPMYNTKDFGALYYTYGDYTHERGFYVDSALANKLPTNYFDKYCVNAQGKTNFVFGGLFYSLIYDNGHSYASYTSSSLVLSDEYTLEASPMLNEKSATGSLYALIIPKQYTITFDANTSSTPANVLTNSDTYTKEMNVYYSEKPGKINMPKGEYYLSLAYEYGIDYFDSNGEAKIIYELSGNVTVKCRWEQAFSGTYIYDEAGLKTIAANGTYHIINDITLQDAWTPIATFSGSIDGHSHTIYNLTVNSSNAYTGFIRTCNGIVSYLNFSNANVSGSIYGENMFAGTIVGVLNSSGKILSCKITNCKVSAKAYDYNDTDGTSRYSIVGGIVGKSSGTIKNCVVKKASIYGYAKKHDYAWSSDWNEACYVYIGGVVGEFYDGVMKNNRVESLTKLEAYAEYRVNSIWPVVSDSRSRICIGGIVGRQRSASLTFTKDNICNASIDIFKTTFNSYSSTYKVNKIEELKKGLKVGYVG